MNYLNNKLIKDINDINPSENSTFFICPYIINTNAKMPFLTYLLHKQTINDMDLCTFLYLKFNINKQETFNNIKIMLNDFNLLNVSFKGAIQTDDNFYLFYECNSETETIKYNSHSILFWATIYEIVHQQYIFNIPIHYSTFTLFYYFPDIIHLNFLQNILPFPQTIYTFKKMTQLFQNYDNEEYIIKNETNMIDINMTRCILFTDKFSNNQFFFKHINDLQIISE